MMSIMQLCFVAKDQRRFVGDKTHIPINKSRRFQVNFCFNFSYHTELNKTVKIHVILAIYTVVLFEFLAQLCVWCTDLPKRTLIRQ